MKTIVKIASLFLLTILVFVPLQFGGCQGWYL